MTTKAIEYFKGDELAASVWASKYALKNEQGNAVEETPADTHRRLAKEFARIEAKYSRPGISAITECEFSPSLSEDEIYNLLSDWFIVPQGSPMSAIGNPYQIQSLSNCYVVNSPSDSYGGITLSDQELAQIMKRRGGVGIDISTIRPRGMRTTNAAGTTDGIGVFMERFSNTTREVAQGGRRGALMISVSCKHPDVETFISIKKDKTKVTGANISVRVTDDFMRAVVSDSDFTLQWPVDVPVEEAKVTKVVKARDIWNQLVQANWESAEPGILFWDTLINNSMSDLFADAGYKTLSTNPCVPGDTLILTPAGYVEIESLVGKNTVVWNGVEWSNVIPFPTGTMSTVVVGLSDGTSLKCTENHEFIIQEGWAREGTKKKVKAEDLSPGMKLAKFEMPVVHEGENYPIDAYSQGFYAGDGTSGFEYSFVYSPKYKCCDRLIGTFRDEKSDRRLWRHGPMLEKNFVPVKGSLDYCLNWIAGLLDSDGCVTKDENGNGYQITSIDKQFLVDIRLMLSRLGVRAKVVKGHAAGNRRMPDGHGGHALYHCQEGFRLLIGNQDAWHLGQIGLKTSRLVHNGQKPQRDARQFVKVVSVEESEPCETFCFKEPKLGQGTFNGIVTGQCGELPLNAHDSCRLALVNLTKFVVDPFTPGAHFDYQKFHSVCRIAQRLMDDLVDLELEAVGRIIDKVESDPEPEHVKAVELNLWKNIYKTAAEGRRTGLGPTGLGDMLAMLNVKYGSDLSVGWTESVYKAMALAAHEESVSLGKERGVFPACEPSVYRSALEAGSNPFLTRLCAESPKKVTDSFLSRGRRNIALTTTAPAGSMSIMTQTTSGCEPVFMLSYTRRKKVNPSDPAARVDFVDQLGDKWTEFLVYHHGLKNWMEVTGETDVTKSPYHGATANEIDWLKSVEIQAAAQRWVEHAISKTCNLPQSVTKDQVSDLYLKAWNDGCKGFTIYRDGSRSGVLVNTEEKKAEPKTREAPKRPDVLPCDIHRTIVAGNQCVMLVGLLDGKPYEVFFGLSKNLGLPKSKVSGTIQKVANKDSAVYNLHIPVGNEGEQLEVNDIVEAFDNPLYGAFTRTLSLSLRHGVPIKYIVEQLRKDKHSDMTSFASAVARVLAKHYIVDGEKASEKKCSSCEGSNIAYLSGCATCMDCGSSKCS